MQINNSSLNFSTPVGQVAPADPSQTGRVHGHHHHGGDSVQISSLASQLSADSSKLQALQTAYQSGRYNISPYQVANGLIDDAIES